MSETTGEELEEELFLCLSCGKELVPEDCDDEICAECQQVPFWCGECHNPCELFVNKYGDVISDCCKRDVCQDKRGRIVYSAIDADDYEAAIEHQSQPHEDI